MEKCCRTCRFFTQGVCRGGLDEELDIDDLTSTIISLSEDGVIDDLIRETLSYNAIVRDITEKLKEEDTFKKAKIKSINKINFDKEETNYVENVDSFIYNSLVRCIKNQVTKNELTISNPDEFYCSNWR